MSQAYKQPAPKEDAIVKSIRRWLKSLPRCYHEKRWGGGYSKAGQPDISGCINGRSFQLEVKRPGGVLGDRQRIELDMWERAGAVVGVVYSLDDVRRLFDAQGLWQEEVKEPT